MNKGTIKKIDTAPDYLTEITKDLNISRGIKIKIDAEGSVVKLFLQELLKKLNVPQSKNEADFGVSFDADGDRLRVFDEKGSEMRGDIVGGIIANSFLRKGDKMISTIVSTKAVDDYFEERGIRVIRSSVGHYYIKEAMKKKNAVFGAETSGHYYFKHLHYAESAFFAMIKILEALDKNPGKKISDLAKPFQKYFHSGEINLQLFSREEWENILQKIKEKYKDGKQSFEDGILVEYPRWWFSLRPSNTEPVVRLVLEAKTKEAMEEKKKELLLFLK